MRSLKLKTQDEGDQGFSVQKLIAAAKPTKLAYKIVIKKITTPQKSQEKWVKRSLWFFQQENNVARGVGFKSRNNSFMLIHVSQF